MLHSYIFGTFFFTDRDNQGLLTVSIILAEKTKVIGHVRQTCQKIDSKDDGRGGSTKFRTNS